VGKFNKKYIKNKQKQKQMLLNKQKNKNNNTELFEFRVEKFEDINKNAKTNVVKQTKKQQNYSILY
jgi:hypothetical protein